MTYSLNFNEQVNSIFTTWKTHLGRMEHACIGNEIWPSIRSANFEAFRWLWFLSGTIPSCLFFFFVLSIFIFLRSHTLRWDGGIDSLSATLYRARPDMFPLTNASPIPSETPRFDASVCFYIISSSCCFFFNFVVINEYYTRVILILPLSSVIVHTILFSDSTMMPGMRRVFIFLTLSLFCTFSFLML
jgi:hypothetical protein